MFQCKHPLNHMLGPRYWIVIWKLRLKIPVKQGCKTMVFILQER